MKLSIAWVLSCAALSVTLVSPAAAQSGAEQLYRSNQGQGLKLSIELKRGQGVRMVSPQTTFLTGDEIRLHFSANFDGYVYALNETPSGKTVVLFPTEEAGTYNRVQAGQDYTIPATDGWFRFVGEAGVERIHMIASAHPIPEIGGASGAGPSTVAKTPAPVNARPPSTGTPPSPVAQAASPTQAPPPPPSQTPTAATAKDAVKTAQNQKSQATSTYSAVQKDVGKVKGGVSLTKTVTGLPKDVAGIFSGIKSRDILIDDEQQEGLTYVAAAAGLSDQPVYFIVELVHQ